MNQCICSAGLRWKVLQGEALDVAVRVDTRPEPILQGHRPHVIALVDLARGTDIWAVRVKIDHSKALCVFLRGLPDFGPFPNQFAKVS